MTQTSVHKVHLLRSHLYAANLEDKLQQALLRLGTENSIQPEDNSH